MKLAIEILKSAKKGNGERPVVKRLFARFDKYDAKVDLERGTVTIALFDGYKVTLDILHRKKYLKRFEGWEWYNLVLKYDDKEDAFFVCIDF